MLFNVGVFLACSAISFVAGGIIRDIITEIKTRPAKPKDEPDPAADMDLEQKLNTIEKRDQ